MHRTTHFLHPSRKIFTSAEGAFDPAAGSFDPASDDLERALEEIIGTSTMDAIRQYVSESTEAKRTEAADEEA